MGQQMAPAVRDGHVRRLAAQGWSVRRIAKAVGMSSSGVYYVLKPRAVLVRYDMCEGCGEDVRVDLLVDGLCGQNPECR